MAVAELRAGFGPDLARTPRGGSLLIARNRVGAAETRSWTSPLTSEGLAAKTWPPEFSVGPLAADEMEDATDLTVRVPPARFEFDRGRGRYLLRIARV